MYSLSVACNFILSVKLDSKLSFNKLGRHIIIMGFHQCTSGFMKIHQRHMSPCTTGSAQVWALDGFKCLTAHSYEIFKKVITVCNWDRKLTARILITAFT